MQRCLFLIFFSAYLLSGYAQKTDVLHTELSYWIKGTEDPQIKAKALLTLKINGSRAHRLDFLPGNSIEYIRIRQGRLKEQLNYTRKGKQLILNLPEKYLSFEKLQIEFSYTINIQDSLYQSFVKSTEEFLAFNVFNMTDDMGAGISGMFYPSVSQDLSILKLNLTSPKSLNTGTLGEREFIVDHGDNRLSHFWKSRMPYTPEQFYLFIGNFEEFDTEELGQKHQLSEQNLQRFEAEKKRTEFSEVLSYLFTTNRTTFDDSILLKLDSLSQIPLAGFYIPLNELTKMDDSRHHHLEKWLTFMAFDNDTAKAAYAHFHFNSMRLGSDWVHNFVESQWNNLNDTLPVNTKSLHLGILQWLNALDPTSVKRYLSSESDLTEVPADSCIQQFVHQLIAEKRPPHVKINYRYRDGIQHIYLEQDTAYSNTFSLPLAVYIYGRDTSFFQEVCAPARIKDTLRYPVNGSPQAVAVKTGRHFPAFVDDNRPDVYYLYQLSNAETEDDRIAALRSLFKASNANLFSTALGIAMDDNNWVIRLEALEKAGNLNAAGQRKLKDTILTLATQDPNPDVRKKANALKIKYYQDK